MPAITLDNPTIRDIARIYKTLSATNGTKNAAIAITTDNRKLRITLTDRYLGTPIAIHTTPAAIPGRHAWIGPATGFTAIADLLHHLDIGEETLTPLDADNHPLDWRADPVRDTIAAEYRFDPAPDGAPSAAIEAKEMRDMLNRIAPMVNRKSAAFSKTHITTAVLTKTYITATTGKLTMEATDRYQAIRVTRNATATANLRMLPDFRELKRATAHLKGMIRLTPTPGDIISITADSRPGLDIRLHNSTREWPNIGILLTPAADSPVHMTVKRAQLIEAIRNAMSDNGDERYAVLEIHDNGIDILDELPAEPVITHTTATDVALDGRAGDTIRANSAYLTNQLKAMQGDTVTLGFDDPHDKLHLNDATGNTVGALALMRPNRKDEE